jgi:Ankyrin repeats (3 copies)
MEVFNSNRMETVGKVVQGNSGNLAVNGLVGTAKVAAAAYLTFRFLPKISSHAETVCFFVAVGLNHSSLAALVFNPRCVNANKRLWWMASCGLMTLVAGIQLGALLHFNFRDLPIFEGTVQVLGATFVAHGLFSKFYMLTLSQHAALNHARRRHPLHDLDDDHLICFPSHMVRGIDIDDRDDKRRTPLFAAIQGGNDALAKLFIEGGASLAVQDRKGRTPLVYAAARGQWSIARLIRDDKNCNPIDKVGRETIRLIQAVTPFLLLAAQCVREDADSDSDFETDE